MRSCIVTARPPKRRPPPSQPKPAIASRIVVTRKRGPVVETQCDPEAEAAAAAFFARMIRPPV